MGVYPRMSLAEARRTSTPTLWITFEVALSEYKSKLKVRRPEQVEWLLSDLRCNDLLSTATKVGLVAKLQEKAATAPVMANRMLTRWQDFFNFCVQQGWIQENPLAGVQRKFVGGKETSRNRVLSWEEIKSLMASPPTQYPHVLFYILLTGLRPSEAIWSLRNKVTRDIPTKTSVHSLPKSHLIHVVQRHADKLPLPASDETLSNAMRRKKLDYRPHDLRRTFVTRLADLGVAPHVVEKLVNHRLQGVMAVYNHAEYWPERHAAQRLWDRKLIELLRAATLSHDPSS